MSRNNIKINSKILSNLIQMGENIKLARLRRNITMEDLSIQANISIPTLRNIESGNPNTSIGSYLKVLSILGLEKDIARVAYADGTGRQIQDKNLGQRVKK